MVGNLVSWSCYLRGGHLTFLGTTVNSILKRNLGRNQHKFDLPTVCHSPSWQLKRMVKLALYAFPEPSLPTVHHQ